MLLNYQNTLIFLVIWFFFQCLQFILLIILVTDLVLLKMSSLSELFLSSLNCGKNTSHANCPLKFVSEQ